MEFIVEFLFEALFELFSEFIVELLLVAGAEFVKDRKPKNKESPKPSPIVSYLALMLFGALGGLGLAWLNHAGYVPQGPMSFWLVLIGPFFSGAALYAYGRWRQSRGHLPSVMATFWGGTLFAFCFSLARWLMLA